MDPRTRPLYFLGYGVPYINVKKDPFVLPRGNVG